jgi:hypothetical protein
MRGSRCGFARGVLAALAAGAALSALTPLPRASAGGKTADLFWQHPDLDSLRVRSVVFLPAISFDHNLKKEHAAEDAAAQALRDIPYRWISPTSVQILLKVKPAAESLWAVQRESALKTGRVDSSAAIRLCTALHAGALLTLRVDLMEQNEPEWNQAGKPTTTITCHAALVDSLGRLLWTASGSETGEGPYHDPNAGVLGVQGSGLGQKALTGQMGAPTYAEVGSRLFARWAERFPRPAGADANTP